MRDILFGHTFQVELYENKLSSFLKKVSFSDQEFVIDTLIFNIKYNYLKF